MCGFIYNVNNFPILQPLLEISGYNEQHIREIIQSRHLHPTDTVLNLVPSRQGLRILPATWWLATNDDGSVNHQLTTFNAKSTRLASAPLHLSKPRSIRTVVLASGFCEWQPIFSNGRLLSELTDIERNNNTKPIAKQPYLITQAHEGLMLLAAVSKLRLDSTGKPKINTAIVTLPTHAEFSDIHHKSFPLILELSEIKDWLNPKIETNDFKQILNLNHFRQPYTATPVDKNFKRTGPEIRFTARCEL